jgi:hypothetical protein
MLTEPAKSEKTKSAEPEHAGILSLMKRRQAESTEPEPQDAPQVSRRRKTLLVPTKAVGIFSQMAFSVSYVAHENEKQRVVHQIKQNGGRILDSGFEELFDLEPSALTSPIKDTANSSSLEGKLVLNTEAREIGFTCLIADTHSRKAKWMQALALGLPCISGKWVEDCVICNKILDWDAYLLAAGESSFLRGAIRSRNLKPYSAATATFVKSFSERPLLLSGKSILLVMGKGKNIEDRKKAYVFLTQALGARQVKRAMSNEEARKLLLETEDSGEKWDWVYVDKKEEDAEKAIFGPNTNTVRKRKRHSDGTEESDGQPKRVKIINDEFVVQSLILGRLLEEA